jgi:hypothetical protein
MRTEGLLSEFWAWLERVDDSVFGVWRIRDTDTLERDSRTDAQHRRPDTGGSGKDMETKRQSCLSPTTF